MIKTCKLLPILLFALSISSCTRDPLQGISQILTEGTHRTGSKHLNIFQSNRFAQDAIRVVINGSTDLNLDLVEGREYEFNIVAQPLYEGFPFVVDHIDIDISKHLKFEDIKWVYDKEKKSGTLTWKASETFTKKAPFRRNRISAVIKLKDKDGHFIVIKRDLPVTVQKKYDPPKIVKLEYGDKTYLRLEDNHFYEIPEDEEINLRLDRNVYSIDRVTSENSSSEYSIKKVFKNFNKYNLYNVSIFKQGHPLDSVKLIPDEVKSRLRNRIYEKKHKDCPSQPQQKEQGQKFCYVQMKNEDNPLYLYKDIYELYYSIPKQIKIADKTFLSYKTQLYIDGGGDECYISDKRNMNLSNCSKIQENTTFIKPTKVYIFDGKKIHIVSPEKLKIKFRKIPNYIKMQLHGSRPNDIDFIFNAPGSSESILKIHIEDSNYTQNGPNLILSEDSEQPSLLFSRLQFLFHKKTHEEKEGYNLWTLEYIVKDNKIFNLKKYFKSLDFIQSLFNSFYLFSFKLIPESSTEQGAPLPISFTILPQVQTIYYDYFDEDQDIEYSQNVNSKWVEGSFQKQVEQTFLSISHQLKVQYALPKKSLDKFLENTPLKNDIEEVVYLEHILDILDVGVAPKFSFSSLLCQSKNLDEEVKDVFQDNACECSPFDVSTDVSDRIHIESLCQFKTKFTLSKKRSLPHYFYYKYELDNPFVHLKYDLFDFKDIYTLDLYGHLTVNTQNQILEDYGVHIFSNLTSDLSCFMDDNLKKQCTISYNLASKKNYFLVLKGLQTAVQNYLSMNLSCFNSKGESIECSCEDGLLFQPKGEIFSISKQCQFPGETSGEIKVFLESVGGRVFFVDTFRPKDLTEDGELQDKGFLKKSQEQTFKF